MEIKSQITGYILAGGKSSRMGTDKGLMGFRGKPVIAHVLEAMKPELAGIVIISGNRDYQRFGVEVVPDIIPGCGPAGGIYTALSHSSTPYNFITSCDMPLVHSAGIKFITGAIEEHELVLPVHDGHLEPLFGVYAKSCLSRWDVLIQQGFLKLHEMVARFQLLKLEVSGNPLFKGPFFLNINTPEDLERALINTNL